jgi:ABC-type uncharacterized transport system permease subunit
MARSRLSNDSTRQRILLIAAFVAALTGLIWHAMSLQQILIQPDGLSLSIGNVASFIALQLALIGILGALEPKLRGVCGGLFVLAAIIAATSGVQQVMPPPGGESIGWQLKAHVLISLFAYGLLTVGAIVALFALVQEKRLHGGNLGAGNQLFAPLETTERLLYGIATGGFLVLLLAVFSGFAFVDNLFAQHLVHKTALSLLALVLFGLLVCGRQFAGWRGKRAVYLYLWGFVILCLAYFGSRYILEEILGRSWS